MAFGQNNWLIGRLANVKDVHIIVMNGFYCLQNHNTSDVFGTSLVPMEKTQKLCDYMKFSNAMYLSYKKDVIFMIE